MSGPTFFGRFWGARFFGRPYWGPRAVVAGLGSSSGVDDTLLSAAQAARILRERIRNAREGERGRLVLLLALIEGDDDL